MSSSVTRLNPLPSPFLGVLSGSVAGQFAAAAPPVVEPALAEFRPEAMAMPSFYMWTLGCQMNVSDSEEMAGQLLSAGCQRAASMETADLIVINTCAVREHA